MITVKGPIEIKTNLGIIVITLDCKDGEIIIQTFQRNGKRKYKLDTNILDGKLNEDKNYE